MHQVLRNIDFQRLAGVNSVLGIEFDDSAVKVLELAKQGNPLNKYKSSFFAKASFTHEFSGVESKGASLKSALEKSDSMATRAVFGIPSQAAKIVETEISPVPERISDWISDHQDDLLKLPIPASELTSAYEIIDSNRQSVRVRITFVRNGVLQEIREVAKSAGIDLIGIQVIGNEGAESEILKQIKGLDADYRACSSLAVSGFFPEITKTTFLPESEKTVLETKTYKSLFQRTVIGVGATLILLLFIPFAVGKYLEMREASLEDQLLSVGPVYSEVRLLEQQVQELEQQLSGGSQSIRRSDIARVLFDVARSSPSDLWFSRLSASNEGLGKQTVTITGYAKGSESISEFMRKIKEEGISKDVSLIRSGTLKDRAQAVQVKNIPPSFIGFELRLELSS